MEANVGGGRPWRKVDRLKIQPMVQGGNTRARARARDEQNHLRMPYPALYLREVSMGALGLKASY